MEASYSRLLRPLPSDYSGSVIAGDGNNTFYKLYEYTLNSLPPRQWPSESQPSVVLSPTDDSWSGRRSTRSRKPNNNELGEKDLQGNRRERRKGRRGRMLLQLVVPYLLTDYSLLGFIGFKDSYDRGQWKSSSMEMSSNICALCNRAW
jgi:hypothetical protein